MQEPPNRPPIWPAIARAMARDGGARVPFRILHRGQLIPVGSVDRRHLGDLQRWPTQFGIDEHGVDLLVDGPTRSQVFGDICLSLRDDGLIPGWRNEPFPLLGPLLQRLAVVERAAARFFGLLTFGAHCNGYVVGAGRRPTHLWIGRRSPSKATDPGLYDNMVGGGMNHGQSLRHTLVREAWEEAGLPAAVIARATEGRLIALDRDIPEGLQNEWIQSYDLELPEDLAPANRDGEVAVFVKMTIVDALALAAGEQMTVDASLVTLDFALRRGLFDASTHAALEAACTPLWRQRPSARAGLGVRWR
jgi:8-oxo-dGTP pyrophosphatase MutT (NUDIX family)